MQRNERLTGVCAGGLAAWLGFGLLVGLGVLAKYYTIALVVALLPVLLVTAEGRRSWRTWSVRLGQSRGSE